MAGRSTANRSETITVPTPRGPVEVVRQQWRSQRPGSRWSWEWLARRAGQRDWCDLVPLSRELGFHAAPPRGCGVVALADELAYTERVGACRFAHGELAVEVVGHARRRAPRQASRVLVRRLLGTPVARIGSRGRVSFRGAAGAAGRFRVAIAAV